MYQRDFRLLLCSHGMHGPKARWTAAKRKKWAPLDILEEYTIPNRLKLCLVLRPLVLSTPLLRQFAVQIAARKLGNFPTSPGNTFGQAIRVSQKYTTEGLPEDWVDLSEMYRRGLQALVSLANNPEVQVWCQMAVQTCHRDPLWAATSVSSSARTLARFRHPEDHDTETRIQVQELVSLVKASG